MIKCDGQVRLSSQEIQQLQWLTGANAGHIKTRQELEGFINDQISRQRYDGPGACLARRVLASYLYR